MKALLRIFRPSRKLVIVIAGAALLVGGTGVAAVYLGAEKYVGVSVASTDGLQCTDVNLITIRKQNHLWIRKYITTDPTDGMTRVRTALRVAQSIYAQQKPELVQVVVLDKNGPTVRSDLRGRAFGADVVYVPDPSKVADGSVSSPYTARYYDGGASDEGLFYGERVDMPLNDIKTMVASLKDHDDCADPVGQEASKDGKDKKKGDAEHASDDHKAGDTEASKEKPHDPGTPPEQHPAPDPHGQTPEDKSSTGFIGVSADAPASPLQPVGNVDPGSGRAGTDPQTTGASTRHSPVTN